MQTASCNLHARPSLLEVVSVSCCLIDSVVLPSLSLNFSLNFQHTKPQHHCELRQYFISFKSIAKLLFLVQPRLYVKRNGEQSFSVPDFYLPLHIPHLASSKPQKQNLFNCSRNPTCISNQYPFFCSTYPYVFLLLPFLGQGMAQC